MFWYNICFARNALAIELAALLHRSFPCTLFSRNFQNNCSSELLWVAGFERLHSETSLSKTRTTSKNQNKRYTYALQKVEHVCLQNFFTECRSPALIILPCDFINTGLHHRHFSSNVPTFGWRWVIS